MSEPQKAGAGDESAEVPARTAHVQSLRGASDSVAAGMLAAAVQANLEHLWEHGGRVGVETAGLSPEWIYVRWPFVSTPPSDPRGPPRS